MPIATTTGNSSASSGISDINALYNMINGVTVSNSGHTDTDTGKTTTINQNTHDSGQLTQTASETNAQSATSSSQNSFGTSTTFNSGRTDTSHTESKISAEQLNSMLKATLEGTAGLAAVSSGQRAGGGYNSTVNTMLTDRLLTDSAAAVLNNFRTTDTTNNIGSSSSTNVFNNTTNTNSSTNSHSATAGGTLVGPSDKSVNQTTVVGPSSSTVGASTVTTGGIDAEGILKVAAVLGGTAGISSFLGGGSTGTTTGGTPGGNAGGSTTGGTTGTPGGSVGISIGSGSTFPGGTNINTGGTPITVGPGAGVSTDPNHDPNADENPDLNGTVGYDPNADENPNLNGSVGDPIFTAPDTEILSTISENNGDDTVDGENYADGGVVSASDGSIYEHLLSAHRMTLAALTGGGTGLGKTQPAGVTNSSAGNDSAADSSVKSITDNVVSSGGGSGGGGETGTSATTATTVPAGATSVSDLSAGDISKVGGVVKQVGSLTGNTDLKVAGNIANFVASPGIMNASDIASRAFSGDSTNKDLGDVARSLSAAGAAFGNSNLKYLGAAGSIASSDNPGNAALNVGLNIATGGLYGKVSDILNTASNPTTSGVVNTIASFNPITAVYNGVAKLTGLPTLGDLASNLFGGSGVSSDYKNSVVSKDTSTADTTAAVAGQTAPSIVGMPAQEINVADTTPAPADTGTAVASTGDTGDTEGDTGGDSNIYTPDLAGEGYGSSDYFSSGCVHVDSYLPDGRRAGDIKVGDTMILASADDLEPALGEVTYSRRKDNIPGYCIVTSLGFSLVCSDTAPIPTRAGELLNPDSLLGEEVAVHQGDLSSWDRVTSVKFLGPISVQHITVGNQCFWAGYTKDKYILHHNMKATSGEAADYGYGDDVFAADGMIPGVAATGTADNMRINVTPGEGILPEDVMNVPGMKEHVEELIRKFHTPAVVQRNQQFRRM